MKCWISFMLEEMQASDLRILVIHTPTKLQFLILYLLIEQLREKVWIRANSLQAGQVSEAMETNKSTCA